LTKYLGGDDGVVTVLISKPKQVWPWPFNYCFQPVRPNSRFLFGIKYGALQYVVISPIVAVIAVVLNFNGLYGEGNFDFKTGYVYAAFVMNFSQLLALYALVWLYMVTKEELAPFRPVSKFLVVKSVVFFTFWQSVLFDLLVMIGVLGPTDHFSVGDVQNTIQDFAVCIEMFVAAIFHKYTFSCQPYIDGSLLHLLDETQHELGLDKKTSRAGVGTSDPVVGVDDSSSGSGLAHGGPRPPSTLPPPIRTKVLREGEVEIAEDGGWVLFDPSDPRFAELDKERNDDHPPQHEEANPWGKVDR